MKPMADEQPPSVQFEDVPIDGARRMGRGPRMEPTLYDTLRQKIAPCPPTPSASI
jgi:hypothetical protein